MCKGSYHSKSRFKPKQLKHNRFRKKNEVLESNNAPLPTKKLYDFLDFKSFEFSQEVLSPYTPMKFTQEETKTRIHLLKKNLIFSV